MKNEQSKIKKEKNRTFNWHIILITAVIVLFVNEGWRVIKDRVRYKIEYQMEISPYKLENEKTVLGLFKFTKPLPATKVRIVVANRGLKSQKNVGLYIRFTKPIVFTYVAREIPINDNKGESLIGNSKAFMGEKAAGINMPMIPSGSKFPISFILDCEYSKEIQDKDKLIEFFKLTSETK
ncbi:MAG: hypothetical protein WBC22_17280 [Sedimentisphaerales bacterium]